MKKIFGKIVVENELATVFDANGNDVTNLFRDDMIKLAYENNQALMFDEETSRARRIDVSELPVEFSVPSIKSVTETSNDPVLAFIQKSNDIKPDNLEMSATKWKYLVRSAVRGKNIMMVGPAGCGKTMAAKALPEATDRPFFYFNLGATQDPRATLIGNTHFTSGETMFDQSAFVKAIQTENAVILLDELSRAHPEAWNILMTVLDESQRYLRLDEAIDSPTIKVAEGVSFIATANIGTEYTSTRTLDRALMDRFEIIEVDILTKKAEQSLLTKRFAGKVSAELIHAVADIADSTRTEWRSEEGKLGTMISTRITVRLCELLADGFTLQEATEVAVLPFFDASGGADSERTFVKQIIQKHLATEEQDIFNTKTAEPREGTNGPLPF
jgi:midasin (ATPase involved in ribosome maturation)